VCRPADTKISDSSSFLKRFHLPLWLVEARVIRRRSPVPLDETLMAEKEALLADLRGVRKRGLALISETERRESSAYCWRHPSLGMLNGNEGME